MIQIDQNLRWKSDSDISENFTRLSPLRISRRLQPCGHFLCLQPTFLHFCNETCRRGYAKWKGQWRTNKQLNSFEVYEHFTCLNRFRLSKLRTSSDHADILSRNEKVEQTIHPITIDDSTTPFHGRTLAVERQHSVGEQ